MHLRLSDILVWSRIRTIPEGETKNSHVFLKIRGSKKKQFLIAGEPEYNNGKFGLELKEKNTS